MTWPRVIFGTVMAFLVPLLTAWLTRRRNQPFTAKHPTYENLKSNQDALNFSLTFALFWIMMVAPVVNWTFAGDFSGVVVALCFAGIFVSLCWIFRWLDRRYPPVKAPPNDSDRTQ